MRSWITRAVSGGHARSPRCKLTASALVALGVVAIASVAYAQCPGHASARCYYDYVPCFLGDSCFKSWDSSAQSVPCYVEEGEEKKKYDDTYIRVVNPPAHWNYCFEFDGENAYNYDCGMELATCGTTQKYYDNECVFTCTNALEWQACAAYDTETSFSKKCP